MPVEVARSGFKPRYGQEQKDRGYIDFEDLMDVLVLGTDEQINKLDMSYEKGHELAEIIAKKPKNEAKLHTGASATPICRFYFVR